MPKASASDWPMSKAREKVPSPLSVTTVARGMTCAVPLKVTVRVAESATRVWPSPSASTMTKLPWPRKFLPKVK
ncbi:hypothetical protein D9M69_303630 [compost metagenome]